MYNKTDLQEKDIYCYDEPTNDSIINGWKEAKHSLTFSDYDLENEIWHFGIIMFSENYTEMIPGLPFIKSIAEFKNENKEDFSAVVCVQKGFVNELHQQLYYATQCVIIPNPIAIGSCSPVNLHNYWQLLFLLHLIFHSCKIYQRSPHRFYCAEIGLMAVVALYELHTLFFTKIIQ